jgi:hypothetical protein
MAFTVVAINSSTGNKDSAISQVANDIMTYGVANIDSDQDYQVTQNGTPNKTVQVAKGVAYVPNASYVKGGDAVKYWIVRSDAATTGLTIADNASGNPRIDIICVKIDTGATPGAQGSGSASIVVVQGTAAASPSVPATPSNHLKLAEIAVANGFSSITTANITDKRPVATLLNVATADGGMLNGFISRTVSSSNLTVSITTKNGETPSSYNPVVINIGGRQCRITAALSQAANAGTNWFNAGSSELTGKEIDYFVYLGYRAASNTVFIAYSRIPYADTFGDFNSTSTNERYARFSGSTPASTDPVRLVGRFNATLTTTNWSVPATESVIQYPIYESRQLNWAPTLVGWSGTPTGTLYAYQVRGRNYDVVMRQGTGVASNSTTTTATLPFTPPTWTNFVAIGLATGDDNGASIGGRGVVQSATSTISFNSTVSGGAWTASGTKRISTFSVTVPLVAGV